MSNSSLVSYIKISPYRNSPRNHVIDGVAIHCMAAPLSIERCGEVFQGSRDASSNYGIGPDGRIGLYVEEKDRSHCTSSREVDNRCVTIEVAVENKHPYKCTDKAYKSLITLLVDICERNGISELKWKGEKKLLGNYQEQNMVVHRWTSAKACPGDYLYNLHGQIAREVNELLREKKKPEITEGNTYTLLSDMSVHSGAGSDFFIYKFEALPAALSKKDLNQDGKLDKGTSIKCRKKKVLSNGNIWIRLLEHDYWILAYNKAKDKYNIV